MESLGSYAGSGLVQCANAEMKPLTVRQQLEQQKQSMTDRLTSINEAIEALDENPGVEKVLTLVGRTVRF